MKQASQKYIASRSTNNEERQVTTGESKEEESLLPPLRQVCSSCSSVPVRGPYVMDESLITMVDHGKDSGSYLYDLFRTNAEGGGRRRKQRKKLYKLTSDKLVRQKIISYFYSEQKAIKT